MVKDGRLELDVDERSGEIFYEVPSGVVHGRARTPEAASTSSALAEIGKALDGHGTRALASKIAASSVLAAAKASAEGSALPEQRRRKILVGVVLGGLIPGFGLAYTAPWRVVVASSLLVVVGFKLIGLIPILSAFLLIPFVAICAIASAALGGLYTWQYNQHGKRTPLGDETASPKELLKRLRK
jgi:hypothetical protein